MYLIGAGPGDPGLITVHGLAYLRAADVVVYDELVPGRLLKYARQDAELINIGAAAPERTGQDAIGYLLVEKAREGKLVARLRFRFMAITPAHPFHRGAGCGRAR